MSCGLKGFLLLFAVMVKVTSGSILQDMFVTSTNCILQTLRTQEEANDKRCAQLCISDKDCVGFGYTTTSKECRLASVIIDSETDSQNCTDGEVIYQSSAAPAAFSCVTDGWTYDSDQYTCTRDGCEDGWEYNSARQTCIRMVTSAVNRDTARVGCESMGANLAIFDSQAAINVLQYLVQNKPAEWNGNEKAVWTDGYKSGSWSWSSGSTWFNWNTNEPSGSGDCAAIKKQDIFRFNDVTCAYEFEYVCEREPTVHTALLS